MRIAVAGDGRHARALAGHGAALGGIEVVAPGEAEAVLVFDDLAVAEAALRAGRKVLCGPFVSRTAGDVARLAAFGGVVLPGGEIAHSEAGRRGLAAIRDPGFGAVKSMFVAIRGRRGAAGAVLEMLAEAVDFVLEVAPGPFSAIRVNPGALFGAEVDTYVLVLRCAEDVVASIEVSACLPEGLVLPGLGEIEVEVMGAEGSVRILPGADAVQVWSDAGLRLVPWLNAPVLEMIRRLEVGEGTDGIDRMRGIVAVLEAVN